MAWTDNSIEELWKYKDVIISKIRLVDLLKEYGFDLSIKNTGLFTHQIKCPFHQGKNGGKEKTPSFFISDTTNSFHCFGCSFSGSVIDFVSKIDGVPSSVGLEKLAKKAGLVDKNGNWDELQLSQVDGKLLVPRETIEPYLFEISKLMREYIHQFTGKDNFEKELKWIERLGKKVDDFIEKIDYEDCEYAIDLVKKVKGIIGNKNERKIY